MIGWMDTKYLLIFIIAYISKEIELPNDYNLYNYIFSFGESVEVLEPIEIRNNIRDMINKMSRIYNMTRGVR